MCATACGLALLAWLSAQDAAATPSSKALASWVTDGTVKSVLAVGHRAYVGGSFHYVGGVTGSGAPLDRRSGSLVARFPKVDGDVTASVPDGAGGYYIGGWLAVGKMGRRGLAHVKADGTVDRRWPGTNDYVYALARSGSTLYVGGDFSRIGDVVRRGMTAIDTRSRRVTDWNPGVGDGEVRAFTVVGSTVYIGGRFDSVGSKPRNGLAAVDAHLGTVTAGTLNPWRPARTCMRWRLGVRQSTRAGSSTSATSPVRMWGRFTRQHRRSCLEDQLRRE